MLLEPSPVGTPTKTFGDWVEVMQPWRWFQNLNSYILELPHRLYRPSTSFLYEDFINALCS